MIDFRYHLVSIVAVFLALTVGLVLGTTMLQDPLLNTMKSETADLRGQSEELRAERDDSELLNAGADQLADAVAGDMLEDRLLDRGVVLVASPGADEDVLLALAGRVEEAGAEVVGQLLLEEAFLDVGSATFVDELALQVSTEPGDLSGNPYDKAGTELGRALAAKNGQTEDGDEDDGNGDSEASGAAEDEDGESDPRHDASTVLSAFAEGGLLTIEDSPARSADTVIVLAPATAAPEEDGERANTALTSFTAALHEQVGPTVLAGGTETGRSGGLIAQARALEPAYATVDVVGRPTGDLVAILALAEALSGSGSAYGIGEGVTGFLPAPLPGPVEPADPDADSDSESEADAEADAAAEPGVEDEARRTVPRNGE
ncbi:copper transporter [Nocardiopsis exhalans]|uniref:Copper transporter n=1 Tax=Nocardiopsis exhalans TaxID=163604 RepID=A0ABY5D503_9ACTN|nr:copper transporter [Nocardiopsis exhalans]USY18178.1 copper transporter [Nocardiopsis exhalans]